MYNNYYSYNSEDEEKKKLRKKCSENLLDFLKHTDQKSLDNFFDCYKNYCNIHFKANIIDHTNLYNDDLFIGFEKEIEDMLVDDISARRFFYPLVLPMASISYDYALKKNERLFNLGTKSINGEFFANGRQFDKKNIALLQKLFNDDTASKFDFVKSGTYQAQADTYKFLENFFSNTLLTVENDGKMGNEMLANLCNQLISIEKYVDNLSSKKYSDYEKELHKLDLSPVKDWQNKTTDKIFDHISNAKVIKNNFEELVASLQIYCDDELIKKIRNLVNMTDDETYVDLQTTLCDSQYYKVNENDIDELYQKTHRDLEHLFYILKKVRKEETYNYLLERFGYEQIFKDMEKCDEGFKNEISMLINKRNRAIINKDLAF